MLDRHLLIRVVLGGKALSKLPSFTKRCDILHLLVHKNKPLEITKVKTGVF